MKYAHPGETIEMYLTGAPGGPEGTLTFQIVDPPDGTVLVAETTAGITEVVPGAYVWEGEAPGAAGTYLAIWEYGATTAEEELSVVADWVPPIGEHAGYPSREALIAASTVTELTDDLTEAQQDALREEAIDDIERFTGQQFVADTDDIVLDGSGGRELYLPKRIDTLTGITVEGTSLDLTDVTVSADGKRLYFAAISDNYAVQAMRDSAYDSRTFRRGAGTVILEGTFGWASVPSDVVTAIRWEMEDRARAEATGLAGSVAAFRRLGMTEIAQGNLRGSLATRAPALSPRTMDRLRDYVWTGPSGYVV